MLSYLILLLSFLLVSMLLLWQWSNIHSLFLGAPAISSPKHDLWKELADPNKSILDLGCGNGSLCLRMAPFFQQVYGVEYSIFYFLIARFRTVKNKNIQIIYGNFFKLNWPKTELIHCYLLPGLLNSLAPKLLAARQAGVTVVSYAFKISDWSVDRVINREKQKLYIYASLANTDK